MVQATTRRETITGALALTGMSVFLRPALATPERLAEAIAATLGGRPVRDGRVKLDIPRLAESGLSVSLDVAVESPMTEADHVRTIHLFAEKNPLPNIARFHLSARSGKAQVTTRIRLADTQIVTAIAEMSDGTFWRDQCEVVITIAACTEPA